MNITISQTLAVKIQRMLEAYSAPATYTERPRIGGVMQGCPRGPKVTPEKLAFNVRMLRELWKDEVRAQLKRSVPTVTGNADV